MSNQRARLKVRCLMMGCKISAQVEMNAPAHNKTICAMDNFGSRHDIDIRSIGFFDMDDIRAYPRDKLVEIIEAAILARRTGK